MGLNDRYFYSAERDVPIDLTRRDEEGTRYAQFYLERVSQNSNIYYIEQQEGEQSGAIAAREREDEQTESAPASMLWRLAWLCSAGGVIALALFVVPRVIPLGQQARNMDHAVAYERVVSAQKAVLAGDVNSGIAGLRDAKRYSAPQPQTSSGIASVIGVVSSVFETNVVPASTLDAVLADVVDRSAASMAPLADLSFASFFASEDGEAAGDIIERAFGETKNAEAAIENAEQALLIAEENGDAGVLRATLGPQLSVMKANLERYENDLALASWVLGVEYPRRFLIVAQDASMARPTGGSIRTLGVVTMEKGAITDMAFHEVYSVDGQLQTNVIPPEPVQKVATAWAIHDANWFLDFPLSAGKIAYFYEQAGGKRLDGVIALNDHLLRNLLAVTGPVSGSNDTAVNAESGSISGDPLAVGAIVKVLGTLHGEKAYDALQAIMDGLRTKDVLVWISDRDRQEAVSAKEWSGSIAAPDDADYFAVAASDMEGKGSAGMTGSILKETMIGEQGELANTVVVEFPGTEDPSDAKLRYLRVYVPFGSELLEASHGAAQTIVPQIDYAKERFVADADVAASMRAFYRDEETNVEIYEESGKTVFALWMLVGEKSARAVFRYSIPVRLSDANTMASVFHKQPGMDMKLHFSVIPWGTETVLSESGFDGEFQGSLDADTIFTMTIK